MNPPTRRMRRGRNLRSHRGLVTVLLAAVLLLVLAGPSTSVLAAGYTTEELQFFDIINEYRESNGLEPLLLSDALSDASTKHNLDMGKYEFFSHTTEASDYFPSGASLSDRMAASGYDYNTDKGENIAAGGIYSSASGVFEGWKSSPDHDDTMRNANFKVIGISREYVAGSPYNYYWTTDFGGYVDSTAHSPGDGSTSEPTTTTTNQTTTTTTNQTTTTTTNPEPTTTTTTEPELDRSEPDEPTQSPSFTDVPSDYRFYNEIITLAEGNIINGFPDGGFAPNDPVKRAQFAKIIMLALDRHTDPLENSGPSTFPDVVYGGSPYPFDYVEEAAGLGVIRGFGDGTFRPYRNITRVQLTLMLVRAGKDDLAEPPAGYRHGFNDVPAYADREVRIARYNGLLSGKSPTVFGPYGDATRGQVAKMTCNLVELLGQ